MESLRRLLSHWSCDACQNYISSRFTPTVSRTTEVRRREDLGPAENTMAVTQPLISSEKSQNMSTSEQVVQTLGTRCEQTHISFFGATFKCYNFTYTPSASILRGYIVSSSSFLCSVYHTGFARDSNRKQQLVNTELAKRWMLQVAHLRDSRSRRVHSNVSGAYLEFC